MPAVEFQTLVGAWESGADASYAEINEEALPAFYDWYRAKLFDLGLAKWDARQDCDDFANLYADFLQLKFFLSQWGSSASLPEAQALAVARYWYRPGAGPAAHAINAVATQNGLRFLEPQTGQFLTLTSNEIASRLRVIF
jgi:hypothetical protein